MSEHSAIPDSAEADAPDDVWCCRECHAIAQSISPLLPADQALLTLYREDETR